MRVWITPAHTAIRSSAHDHLSRPLISTFADAHFSSRSVTTLSHSPGVVVTAATAGVSAVAGCTSGRSSASPAPVGDKWRSGEWPGRGKPLSVRRSAETRRPPAAAGVAGVAVAVDGRGDGACCHVTPPRPPRPRSPPLLWRPGVAASLGVRASSCGAACLAACHLRSNDAAPRSLRLACQLAGACDPPTPAARRGMGAHAARRPHAL